MESRLAALSSEVTAAALLNCFGLLSRLREVESMVRVLQLVSVLVEVSAGRKGPESGRAGWADRERVPFTKSGGRSVGSHSCLPPS